MNSFVDISDYRDIDQDDHLLSDGGPPMDGIIRAYWHFTRILKLWPSPSLDATRWQVNTYEGPEVQTDEGPDSTERRETTIELRDFNAYILAVYAIDDNDRLRVKEINRSNPNLRYSIPGKRLPGKRVRA